MQQMHGWVAWTQTAQWSDHWACLLQDALAQDYRGTIFPRVHPPHHLSWVQSLHIVMSCGEVLCAGSSDPPSSLAASVVLQKENFPSLSSWLKVHETASRGSDTCPPWFLWQTSTTFFFICMLMNLKARRPEKGFFRLRL